MNRVRMVVWGGLLAAGFSMVAPQTAEAGSHAAECCPAPAPVCCVTPPPVEVTLCVVDPCTGCPYEVSVCVPACCALETPCLDGWKNGLFGRKVLTYKWPSCDHCVEVVITKHGRTIVRD